MTSPLLKSLSPAQVGRVYRVHQSTVTDAIINFNDLLKLMDYLD